MTSEVTKNTEYELKRIRRGADKSLAFPICSTIKRTFLGWVKEVRRTKSYMCGAQGGICRVNTFFSIP
jgi:hypothetical protein